MPRSASIDRWQLVGGPYETPRFHYGDVVFDQRFGEVEIVGLSNARIPRPIGKRQRTRSLVLFGYLIEAVCTESNQAVAHWWGVTGQTVTKWRQALDVTRTVGTTALQAEYMHLRGDEMRAKMGPMTEQHREAIRQSKLGVARPPHVIEAMRKGRTGKPHRIEARQRMRDSHRLRGTRPPAAGRTWAAWEDALFESLPAADVAARTGRTLNAVYLRRQKLGYHDGRRKR